MPCYQSALLSQLDFKVSNKIIEDYLLRLRQKNQSLAVATAVGDTGNNEYF